jgi:hypothetical protein
LRLVSGEIGEQRQAKIGTKMSSSHITPVGGNVFADLGFEAKEALELQADSRRTIAERLAAADVWMKQNPPSSTDLASLGPKLCARVEMANIQTDAPLSQNYEAITIDRLDRDPAFTQALPDDAASLTAKGEVDAAQLIIETMACRTKNESA